MLAQVIFSCFLINAVIDKPESTLIAHKTNIPCDNIDYTKSYKKVWPISPPELNDTGPTARDCQMNKSLPSCKNG